MVYMAGDNNLSAAGEQDLSEMRTVGSTSDVHVVVEFDRAGSAHETRRYHVQQQGMIERVVSLGETDCGDPQVLLDFIRWTAQEYPAERYALVLWNHGSGWEPSEMDRVARSVGTVGYNPRETTERAASPLRRALFRGTLERLYGLPTAADRAICSDDGSGHSLDTIELGQVLQQAAAILGQPVDLLGMDACLMSNAEVAYQVRPFARYLVGSEETEPADGWPYHLVLRQLADEPIMPTATFAEQIVTAYVNWYVERHYSDPITQSAMNLSAMMDLTMVLDRMANALIAHMPVAVVEIWQAQRRSARFWHNTLWDVAHFCEELASTSQDQRVRQAAQAVLPALHPNPHHFVIAEGHSGTAVEHCGGVSIYLQPPPNMISRFYDELNYARAHRWLALLRAYHEN